MELFNVAGGWKTTGFSQKQTIKWFPNKYELEYFNDGNVIEGIDISFYFQTEIPHSIIA